MKKLLLLFGALGLLVTDVASAQVTFGPGTGPYVQDITVRAQVNKACRLTISAIDANFGLYDPFDPVAKPPIVIDVTVQCTGAVPFTVALSDGVGAAGGWRGMANTTTPGGYYLMYQAYLETPTLGARLGVWGDGGAMGAAWTGTTGFQPPGPPPWVPPPIVPAFMVIELPAQQAVPAGDYLDTVTMTMTF